MPGAKVRWRRSEEKFEVLDRGLMWFEDDTTVTAAAKVIGPASLTELHRAVDRCRSDMYPGDYLFEIYDAPTEQLAEEEDLFSPRPVSLELADQYTILNLVLTLDPGESVQDDHEVAAILAPLLRRINAQLIEFTVEAQTTATVCRASVKISPRGLTVDQALGMGTDLLLLWEASVGGGLTPATAADLVRAQRADLFIGQPENEWLEVKQASYRLGDDLQGIELAKDVSALANRPEGGLLVIGLVTGRQGGRDVVRRVRTQPMDYLRAQLPAEPQQMDLPTTAGCRGRSGRS